MPIGGDRATNVFPEDETKTAQTGAFADGCANPGLVALTTRKHAVHAPNPRVKSGAHSKV